MSEEELSEEQEEYRELLDSASEALNALSCPYYNGRGICASGCYTEPSCQTDAPTEGWVAQLFESAEKLKRLDDAMMEAMSEAPGTVNP